MVVVGGGWYTDNHQDSSDTHWRYELVNPWFVVKTCSVLHNALTRAWREWSSSRYNNGSPAGPAAPPPVHSNILRDDLALAHLNLVSRPPPLQPPGYRG